MRWRIRASSVPGPSCPVKSAIVTGSPTNFHLAPAFTHDSPTHTSPSSSPRLVKAISHFSAGRTRLALQRHGAAFVYLRLVNPRLALSARHVVCVPACKPSRLLCPRHDLLQRILDSNHYRHHRVCRTGCQHRIPGPDEFSGTLTKPASRACPSVKPRISCS